MRTAVILSGGGAKSAYEAGALKALEDNKVHVDLVIGTSAGALNALLFAAGETDRLYNGAGTGLWQKIRKTSILQEGLLSFFYSRVVSLKLVGLGMAISVLNLFLFASGIALGFVSGRYINFKTQGFPKAVGILHSNFLRGIVYGTIVLAGALLFEYRFVGSVLQTIYHWLRIKLGLAPMNDESLANLRASAQHIPRLTKLVLTSLLKLPADVLDVQRLTESIHEVEAPSYFSAGPLERLLSREVEHILRQDQVRIESSDPAVLGRTFTAWLDHKLKSSLSHFRELMITATDLNAKKECIFFCPAGSLPEPFCKAAPETVQPGHTRLLYQRPGHRSFGSGFRRPAV